MSLWMKSEGVVIYPQADPHSSSPGSWESALGQSQGQQVNPLEWWACFLRHVGVVENKGVLPQGPHGFKGLALSTSIPGDGRQLLFIVLHG